MNDWRPSGNHKGLARFSCSFTCEDFLSLGGEIMEDF